MAMIFNTGVQFRARWLLRSVVVSPAVIGVVFGGCEASTMSAAHDVAASVNVAEELEREGRYALARQQLEVTAKFASQERQGRLLIERCDLFSREHEYDAARRCFRDLVSNVSPELKAEARLRAVFAEVRLGRRRQAQAQLEALIVDQPGSGAAVRGVHHLLELSGEDGLTARQKLGRRLADALEPQAFFDRDVLELCALILLDVGRTERRLGETASSRATFDEAWARGRDTRWADQIAMERARSAAAAGARADAIAYYRAFIDQHDASWRDRSESPLIDDAVWELAELYRVQGLTDDAVRLYHELVRDFPDSCHTVQAKRRLVRLRRHDDG